MNLKNGGFMNDKENNKQNNLERFIRTTGNI
jgi:hypothetical protein